MIYKGTKKADVYLGTADADVVEGFAGKDTLSGAGGDDKIAGGAGDDVVDGGEGNDVLFSAELDPTYGSDFVPSILDTRVDRDTLSGGIGNDFISAGVGDTIDGGAGTDTLALSFAGADAGIALMVRSLLSASPVTVAGTTVSGIEQIRFVLGSKFADDIDASAVASPFWILDAGAGDDHVVMTGSIASAFGGDGDDVLIDVGGGSGDAGDDTISGSDGANSIDGGEGADVIHGGGGNDILYATAFGVAEVAVAHDVVDGGDGDDQVGVEVGDDASGGAGYDVLVLSLVAARHGVVADMSSVASGSAVSIAGGVISGFESFELTMTSFTDTLTIGSALGYVEFDTGAGDDRITLNAGYISGRCGAGDDVVFYRAGDKATVDGGTGVDTLNFSQFDGPVSAGIGGTTVFQDSTFFGFEALVGSAYDDRLAGGGNAHLVGGGGDDMLSTSTGNDWLEGGTGNDVLRSSGGNDRLFGGDGDDTLDPGIARAGDEVNGGNGYDTLASIQDLDLRAIALSGVEFISTNRTLIMGLQQFVGVTRITAASLTIADGGTADLRRIALTAPVQLSEFGNRVSFGDGALRVRGGAGDDAITTGAGADTLYGGGGNDILNAGSTAAGTASNTLYGEDGNDRLIGGAGADIFYGGVGGDLMVGGAGDDRYIDVDSADAITEAAGGGVDTIQTQYDCVLRANVENLVLTGTAVNGTGNGLANAITGNASDNVLDGKAGDDTLMGGQGNDTYVVGSVGDLVIERAFEGDDLVKAYISYTLGANVENLQMMVAGQTGTGNSLDNVITGSAGVDTLVGLGGADTLDGGAGADRLIGGAGGDTYIVSTNNDVVVEFSADVGTDKVIAFASYTIPDNVELLVMGVGGFTGTGNALSNTLVGSDGADTLVGLGGADDLDGGAGADTMIGGADADTYHVDNSGDVIIESTAGPGDTVIATADYILPAEVETLQLEGAARRGTGNDGVNLLIGTTGNDTLSGKGGTDILQGGYGDDILIGGSGQDVLEGDAGADRFVFASGDGSADYHFADGIADFYQFEHDRIDLTAFGHLAFIGSGAFTGGAQVRFEDFDGDTLISIDTNGDRNADMVIGVLGAVSFTAADFILG